MKKSILNGNKTALLAATDTEVSIILDEIKATGANDKEAIRKIVKKYSDNVRFMDDKSGYFFFFSTDGECIYHPIKNELTGTDMNASEDAKGFKFVQAFNQMAKEHGEGFVEYYWDKDGSVQPKISYIKTIPNTNIYIGTGVYADNVEKCKNELLADVNSSKKSYGTIKSTIWTVVLGSLLTLSLIIARNIIKPMKKMVEILSNSTSDISQASRSITEGANMLADNASSQPLRLKKPPAHLKR